MTLNKTYCVETKTKSTKFIYLTNAISGKDAIFKLVCNSADFRNTLSDKESDAMTITVQRLKK
jgi:hypothetical protein